MLRELKVQSNSADVSIDLKYLCSGNYVLKVFNEKKIAVKRVAKI